jgi:integrase
MPRLTTTTIKSLALPAGIADKVIFDDDLSGFGLRIRASGARSWLVQYNVGKRSRRMTLGSPETVGASEAREEAKRILARVKLGQDPAHDKQTSRQDAAHTIGALIPRFLQRQRERLRPRSYVESVRHLERDLRPFHPLSIAKLDRRTIAAKLVEIADSNGPATANRLRSTLSAFCAWAVKEGLLEANPAALTNKAVENGPRDHLISDTELASIWSALGDDDYSVVVKLLALLCARREEIMGLRWDEIDLANALITLAPERCKGKRAFLIPLSPPALAILAARQAQAGDREFVFGTSQRRGLQNGSIYKKRLDEKIAASGAVVRPWVLHDFRRLVSTSLHERLNTPPHIVESCLGHSIRGIAGVYNKSSYIDERRRALQRWADLVTAIVTGAAPAGAVVRLRG